MGTKWYQTFGSESLNKYICFSTGLAKCLLSTALKPKQTELQIALSFYVWPGPQTSVKCKVWTVPQHFKKSEHSQPLNQNSLKVEIVSN